VATEQSARRRRNPHLDSESVRHQKISASNPPPQPANGDQVRPGVYTQIAATPRHRRRVTNSSICASYPLPHLGRAVAGPRWPSTRTSTPKAWGGHRDKIRLQFDWFVSSPPELQPLPPPGCLTRTPKSTYPVRRGWNNKARRFRLPTPARRRPQAADTCPPGPPAILHDADRAAQPVTLVAGEPSFRELQLLHARPPTTWPRAGTPPWDPGVAAWRSSRSRPCEPCGADVLSGGLLLTG